MAVKGCNHQTVGPMFHKRPDLRDGGQDSIYSFLAIGQDSIYHDPSIRTLRF